MNAAAGFVRNRHSNISDCIKISWLPVIERIEYSISVPVFKGLHKEAPINMKLELKPDLRNLRSN